MIWSGTWTTGSITVPELPYYNLFAMKTVGDSDAWLAVRNGNYIVGGFNAAWGGYHSGSDSPTDTNVAALGLRASVNGSTLTMAGFARVNTGTNYRYNMGGIGAIWGVL